MSDWLHTLRALLEGGQEAALVTVIDTQGSTPRAAGTRMLVTADGCEGTIGGGQLEFRVVERARAMLATAPGAAQREMRSFTLGLDMQQCCGGIVRVAIETLTADEYGWIEALAERRALEACVMVSEMPGTCAPGAARLVVGSNTSEGSLDDEVLDALAIERARRFLNVESKSGIGRPDGIHVFEASGNTPALLFELINDNNFHLVLFGAGHVGKALVTVLSGLPCHITWVDSRPEEFPPCIPHNVSVQVSDSAATAVSEAPANSFFLVMTHSHPADFEICKAVLNREFAYLGLIGSRSKRNRFTKNLLRHSIPAEKVARLTCPIGIDTVRGKHPTAIAIAVAAELLAIHERSQLPVSEHDLAISHA